VAKPDPNFSEFKGRSGVPTHAFNIAILTL